MIGRVAVASVLAAVAAAAQTAQQLPTAGTSAGGYQVLSPSVAASSATHRDANGQVTADIIFLWRGSPGWMYRRTGFGSRSGPGSDEKPIVSFSLYEGGLHLTAAYNPASRTAVVLGDPVELQGANVVLVDRVDSPDGPVVLRTASANPTRSDEALGVSAIIRNAPELLEFLRCEQQIPGGLNHPSMAPVCADGLLKGAVKAAPVMHEIPIGPVTNRAAGVAPPPPDRVTPPGTTKSGSGALSGAVAGGWFAHSEPDGTMSLDLLVLWRGTPGWLMQDRGTASSGGGAPGTRRGMNVRFGDRSFYAGYDVNPRRYVIENTVKPLGNDNVVLVDDVDSVPGLRVVKTLRVDPQMSEQGHIGDVIVRSSELVAYLRCDAKVADKQKQMMVDLLCARYMGK
jgi:hypothetical protein